MKLKYQIHCVLFCVNKLLLFQASARGVFKAGLALYLKNFLCECYLSEQLISNSIRSLFLKGVRAHGILIA